MRTIKQELEACENYIYLINTIYSDSVDYEVKVHDNSVYECLICSHLLQPLLENSIKHGIRQKTDMSGKITVQVGKTEQGDIYFKITDDGVGVDPEVAAHLNSGLVSAVPSGPLGFSNVNRRIKTLYGEQYGAEILLVDDKTVVVLTIPAER